MALSAANTSMAYQAIYNMTNDEKIDLVEFILQSMRQTPKKERHQEDIEKNHKLDDALFGCIHLPDDFDYDKELDAALNEKYGL